MKYSQSSNLLGKKQVTIKNQSFEASPQQDRFRTTYTADFDNPKLKRNTSTHH